MPLLPLTLLPPWSLPAMLAPTWASFASAADSSALASLCCEVSPSVEQLLTDAASEPHFMASTWADRVEGAGVELGTLGVVSRCEFRPPVNVFWGGIWGATSISWAVCRTIFFRVRQSVLPVLIISVLSAAPLHSGASIAKGGETARPRLAVGMDTSPSLHEAVPAREHAGACRHCPPSPKMCTRRQRDNTNQKTMPKATAKRAGSNSSRPEPLRPASPGDAEPELSM
eukprot:scaffold10297_cov113-Isochrysis_galbana.AAC.23